MITLWAALAVTTTAQVQTPEQYRQRAGRSYETEYIPKAVAQASKRAGLTPQEGTQLSEAFREHVYQYLDLDRSKSCFSRSDWNGLLDRFDRSVAKRLSGPKAAAVADWRRRPRPEGNALGFLFFSPWMKFEKLDEAVTKKSPVGAIDCGFQTTNSSCPVEQCVLDAVKRKAAFRAMYERKGIDSQVGDAIVGAADGTGLLLRWDSMGARVSEAPYRFRIGRSVHGGEHVDCG